jgi:hypothetical protein
MTTADFASKWNQLPRKDRRNVLRKAGFSAHHVRKISGDWDSLWAWLLVHYQHRAASATVTKLKQHMPRSFTPKDILSDEDVKASGDRVWKKLQPVVRSVLKSRREAASSPR